MTIILADVDATDEEKAVAKELYDMNKQIADAFNENNIKTAREIIKNSVTTKINTLGLIISKS